MKSLLEIFSELATSPPTSTMEPAPNSTPWGLIKNTWPLAFRWPRICEPSLPVTRLSATDDAPGWRKLTWAFLPILNVSHVAIRRSLPWFTVRTLPLLVMVPLPATTWPLVGKALLSRASAGIGTRPYKAQSTAKLRGLSTGSAV